MLNPTLKKAWLDGLFETGTHTTRCELSHWSPTEDCCERWSSNCVSTEISLSEATAQVIKIKGGPRTRASLPRWYMEEKGISYDLIESNRKKREIFKADFLTINPIGKLPVLIDSNILMPNSELLKMFESGAFFTSSGTI